MEHFTEILWSCVGIILTGFVGWLTSYIISLINSKIKNEKTKVFLTTITEIISSAVQCTQQTFVSDLKKDGKFDKEAQEEAFNKTIQNVKNQLTDETKKYIQDNFGDVENYIKTQVEAFIGKNK